MTVDSVDFDELTNSLTQLLKQIGRNIELTLNVSCPGHVLSYDNTTQRAKIRLGRLPVTIDDEVEDPIVIPNVRVRWPGAGTGRGYLTFPLPVGATGLVSFADRCLTLWHKKGTPCDPVNGRTHDLADATFTPDLVHDKNTIAPTNATATVLEGSARIKIGAGATEYALKGTALATAINTIAATLTAVPPAADPASVIVLANANKAALLSLMQSLQNAVSTKVQVE